MKKSLKNIVLCMAVSASVLVSGNAIKNTKERNEAYQLAAKHMKELSKFHQKQLQNKQSLLHRQYLEMCKLYHTYHVGDAPDEKDWVALIDCSKK